MAEMKESLHESPNGQFMDYAEHRRTYEGFLRFTSVGTLWVLCQVVGLAIGGLGAQSHWFLAGFWVLVGTVAALIGLAVRGLEWRPVAIVLIIMLATLLMVTR